MTHVWHSTQAELHTYMSSPVPIPIPVPVNPGILMARTVSVMLSPPFSAALPVPVSVFVFGVSWSPAQTGIRRMSGLEECRNDKTRVCGIAWWQHAIYM